jgi:hypothetical protein
MNIHSQINIIRNTIIQSFDTLDYWLDLDRNIQNHKPSIDKWSIIEILEHISLTNFFLLKLIKKGYQKALKNINGLDLDAELQDYHFLNTSLEDIGKHQSFTWIRPEHMEPTGSISLIGLKNNLDNQKNDCLKYLENMPNGEGILYKTTMTVNDLGKIDVYQYIYFLAMHIQRHIEQMNKIIV